MRQFVMLVSQNGLSSIGDQGELAKMQLGDEQYKDIPSWFSSLALDSTDLTDLANARQNLEYLPF
jgi:hypothetical protein